MAVKNQDERILARAGDPNGANVKYALPERLLDLDALNIPIEYLGHVFRQETFAFDDLVIHKNHRVRQGLDPPDTEDGESDTKNRDERNRTDEQRRLVAKHYRM